jgi:hypothetical protein
MSKLMTACVSPSPAKYFSERCRFATIYFLSLEIWILDILQCEIYLILSDIFSLLLVDNLVVGIVR